MLVNPLALIAEITHRCPLHCVYCSNPLALTAPKSELSTEEWLRVFGEAASLGVLHLHLTGGEPAARADLSELVAGAHQSGLYTNLITSGLGVSRDRLKGLVDAGLDHVQISIQDSEAKSAWEDFRKDEQIRKVHNITTDEMEMLERVALLGEVRSPRDFIYILNTVRHAVGR